MAAVAERVRLVLVVERRAAAPEGRAARRPAGGFAPWPRVRAPALRAWPRSLSLALAFRRELDARGVPFCSRPGRAERAEFLLGFPPREFREPPEPGRRPPD
ncbi:MAG: hypothetical protein Q4P36_02090 [Bowdeniella nasicola]|nr:hypothetical protein [Bowdeniella nasicola]